MNPLLVTGLPRSGTSWVGKMLEASGQVVYVNEPLNPQHPPGRSPGVLDGEVRHRFQYICRDNEAAWLPAFSDTVGLRYRFAAELRRNRSLYDLARMAKYGTSFTVGRWAGRRAMLDDPFALLSTRWLVERLGCRAVVLVRDPVALVGSWRRLGWMVHFHELLEQPLLVRDLLGGYDSDDVHELRSLVGSEDHVARVATLWKVCYDVVHRVFAGLPAVRVQRYEDLVAEPHRTFAELYRFCGLRWSSNVAEAVSAAVSGAAAGHADDTGSHRWTLRFGLSKTAFRPMDPRSALGSYRGRLSEHEIAQVRVLTAQVASRFYSDGRHGADDTRPGTSAGPGPSGALTGESERSP